MPRENKKKEKLISYVELSSVWWSINDALYYIKDEKLRNYLVRKSFEELLKQCGWTVLEWNQENKLYKK